MGVSSLVIMESVSDETVGLSGGMWSLAGFSSQWDNSTSKQVVLTKGNGLCGVQFPRGFNQQAVGLWYSQGQLVPGGV